MTTSTPRRGDAHAGRKPGTVALASYIGTTIEWYDFFIYGIAATLVFRTQFFPEFSETAGTLASLGTFAVGFIARPIGGIVMGHFGDRVGRKSMLVVSLLMMGIATTLIGFLPTFEIIGIWAPILLIVLRLIQGAGVGGEWAGAVLMAVENAPPKRRSLYGCFPQLGLPSGILLSQLAFLLITGVMSPDAFTAWGWRIAFLSSSLLIIVGLVIRLAIEESLDFEKVRDSGKVEKLPVIEVFKTSALQILIGSLASVAAPAIGYLVSVYMVSYGTATLNIPTTTMLWILIGVSVAWIMMMLASALSGDRFGRKITFAVGAGVGVLWAFPLFWLVDSVSIPLIAVALIGITAANSIMAGPQPALITEMFPIRLRYSGASISYTIASVLGGGITPLLATALFAEFGTSMAVSVLIATVCLISLIAILSASNRVLFAKEPAQEPSAAAQAATESS
ncbi:MULTISPECIES: MFS transporter [Prauserella salsuginis group]|uniref:MFS transporter n=1 Tax=Prauserella salsuginis TaxID=387889 RepID=A0ABW6G0W7_9PSEU|nr:MULTISPECIES: MFS transporter [Prauserella salsuginis group]MCR3721965.1 Sugar transporter [Prauserella flava]MCR3735971.1 Sugar transporter [Prauserella salsuginis]